MFPKSGRKFPKRRKAPSKADYVEQISSALRLELGTTAVAAKTIMRWTGASNRSARIWMNGSGSPGGYHLMRLARACDAVFEVLLDLTGREEARLAVDLHAAEVAIARALGAFETLRRQRSTRGTTRRDR